MATLSTCHRCKPILDRGHGLHNTPESRALQRAAASCSPYQSEIAFPTVGLLWRENPSKCYGKSPEKQKKYTENLGLLLAASLPIKTYLPLRSNQGKWHQRHQQTLAHIFPLPHEEQERHCASGTPFLQYLLPSLALAGFRVHAVPPQMVCTTLVATQSSLLNPSTSPLLAMEMLCANGLSFGPCCHEPPDFPPLAQLWPHAGMESPRGW